MNLFNNIEVYHKIQLKFYNKFELQDIIDKII